MNKRMNYNILKKSMLLLLMATITLAVHAVPAKPGLVRTLKLTDGTTVEARLVGDEHGHYWLAADGKAYQAEGSKELFRPIDINTIKAKAAAHRQATNAQFASRLLSPSKVGTVGNYTGKKKGLVILVNFSDVKFKSANNNALYQRIANEKNLSYGNFKGSMYDYFYAQSEGKFELEFDVAGPVTVSKSQSYYGSNDAYGNDKYPATMVIEACKLVNSQVNFADYDWDGDHYVDQVYIIYAGKGEADGGASSTIWPHAYNLSTAYYYGDGSGVLTLDGVKIDTYACGSELNGSGSIAGIGTMCHEFSHCLGYPDFYDTDYSGGQGMGNWDLMDSGSYNGGGYQPAGYTTYERWVAGWKTPITLTHNKAVTGMKSLQDGGESYIIYNNGNNKEYYLLENRQKTGWDASLPGKGLLIIHVDYDQNAWNNNKPNDDPSHQRMTWIPADNKYQYYTGWDGTKYYTEEGMVNDPFPYGSVNSFGKDTTPAAKLYNKNSDGTYFLDSSVEEIKQNSDGTISFKFKGLSNVAEPVFQPQGGTYTEAQQVTITCDTEGAIIHYTTNGTNPTASSPAYTGPITVETTTTIKAIAIADGEESDVVSAKYVILGAGGEGYMFKRVNSISEMVSGKKYIIACGSQEKAAGAFNSTYLESVDVTQDGDIILINDDVAVFVLEGSDNSYSIRTADGNYLNAKSSTSLEISSTEKTWNLIDDESGVILNFKNKNTNYGTILYNVLYPRFKNYTTSPSGSLIYANLYMECDTVTPKQNPILTFSAAEVRATIGEAFEAPTLTTTPADLTVTYTSSKTSVATVNATTGAVTLKGAGTTIITATSAATSTYNSGAASYTLTVVEPTPPEPEGPKYVLVKSTSQLQDKDSIIIVAKKDDQHYVLSTTQNNRNRSAVEVSLNDDNSISPTEATQIIVLEKVENGWQLNVDGSYLCSTSDNNNILNTTTTTGNGTEATISINNDKASILFQGYKRNDLRFNYNNGTPIFSCYSSSSTQTPVMIYKLSKALLGDANGDGFVTVADISLTVEYVLTGSTEEEFFFENADVDGDGAISVNDVTMIVDMILNQ